MFKRKALVKDSLREIKLSLSRYLSIFAIIALGSGFFAGLNSTCPDMKDTAHEYFNQSNLMDLKLMTTIGISADDVSAVNDIEGVSGVMPSYTKDLFLKIDNENIVLKAISFNKSLGNDNAHNLNRPVLLEGRMPEKSGECVIEIKMNSPKSFKIGNKITLSSPDDNQPLSSFLNKDTYEIVGIVSSPVYIGYKRGTTTIGNGEIVSFVLLPQEDFTIPYYTELFATIDGLDKLDPFSKEYKDKLNEYIPKIKEVLEKSSKKRFDELLAVANDKLDKAKSDLKNAEYLATADYNTLISDITSGEASLNELNEQYTIEEAKNSAKMYLIKSAIIQTEDKVNLAKQKNEMIKSNTLPSQEEVNLKINGYKQQIASAEEQVQNIKDPVIYAFDRNSSEDYASFSSDTEKVNSIAKIFPLFFILVTALVCLTTMTRMVEENRAQIGTLKALGYSKISIAFKFLFYGITATILGCGIGLFVGFKTLPAIIFNSYKMLYNIPKVNTPFRWNYAIVISLVAMLCIVATVIFSCLNELKSNPSQIMRPKTPPKGKRILLEKIPFIWSKLGFLKKITLRNLFRYKKRFLMTIIGIAGCTALMLTGFGLNNSIASIGEKQFSKVFILDGMGALKKDADIDKANKLFDRKEISESLPCYQTTIDLFAKNGTRNVNMLIPQNMNELDKFISLQTRKGNEKITLDDNGIIINEKLAILLDLKIGDTVTIQSLEHKPREVKISGINENYTLHYIYLSPKLFNSLYGKEPTYNSIAFNMSNSSAESEKMLASSLLKNNEILGIQYFNDSKDSFKKTTASLNSIVLVLIVCAGTLAFIVLYSLSNINVNERMRELATIKLLGFYDKEVSSYIYRENNLLTFIGMVVGLVLGVFLHRFVIITAEVDLVMFNRNLRWQSFVYAALMTLLFAVIVNLFLHFRLKKINMAESLKSVE